MKKYYPIHKSRVEYWFSDVYNRQQCGLNMLRLFRSPVNTVIFTSGWIDDCSANDKAFNDMSKCNL